MKRISQWGIALAALLWMGSAWPAGLRVENRKIESNSPQATVLVTYPHTGVAAIDNELAAWANEQADSYSHVDAGDVDGGSPWSLDIDYEVVRNDGRLLVILFSVYEYAGGAHPNHGQVTYNFLLPEGARLDIEQIIAGRKGLQRLSALVVAKLKRKLLPDGESDAKWIENGAGPEWGNFDGFVLLPHALRIEFSPYAVGPYSSGAQEVEIPLSALEGALRADQHAPAASFDCDKAGSVVERAICASVEVSRLDRQLAREYQRHANSSDTQQNARIRNAQRAWLTRRDATCGALRAGALERCLIDSYRARREEIKRE